jgi:hypothetical protein
MGAGFIAASLLGSLAGQPAAAYQATFNLRTPNVSNQLTRTFIDGPPSNHTMVMTVGSKDAIAGTSVNVNTTASSGLCVINGSQCAGNETQAATVDLTNNAVNAGAAAGDVFQGSSTIENIVGTGFNDSLYGNELNNIAQTLANE